MAYICRSNQHLFASLVIGCLLTAFLLYHVNFDIDQFDLKLFTSPRIYPNSFCQNDKSTGDYYCGRSFSDAAVRLAKELVANINPNIPQEDSEVLKTHPVFITAASENHAKELERLLQSVRRIYPGSRVIVYDLGLQ